MQIDKASNGFVKKARKLLCRLDGGHIFLLNVPTLSSISRSMDTIMDIKQPRRDPREEFQWCIDETRELRLRKSRGWFLLVKEEEKVKNIK